MRASGQLIWVKQVAHFILLLFFIFVFFSLRAGVSIGCVTIFVFAILFSRHFILQEKLFTSFLAAIIILFLLQIIALSYTTDITEGWRNIKTKSALILTVFGIYGTTRVVRDQANLVKLYYCITLALSCVFYLVAGVLNVIQTNDLANLFYYKLVNITHQHPIFYSVYVFLGLLFTVDAWRKKVFVVPSGWYYAMMVLFILMIVLLSSKLVIGILFLFLFYFITRLIVQKRSIPAIIILSFLLAIPLVLLLTKNPLSHRFRELFRSDLRMVETAVNTPADYFNGYQFRLLQWKLVPEILTEKRSWLQGVSPGDAQNELDKKYIARNMYTGDVNVNRNDEGYLGFYTHNNFLENLLQTGIIGLVIVITIFLLLILWVAVSRDFVTLWIILLLVAVSFTESLFESQYGITMFSVVTALTWSARQKVNQKIRI